MRDDLGLTIKLKGDTNEFVDAAMRAVEKVRKMAEQKPLHLFAGKDDAEREVNRAKYVSRAVYAEQQKQISNLQKHNNNLVSEQKKLDFIVESMHTSHLAEIEQSEQASVDRRKKKYSLIADFVNKTLAQQHLYEHTHLLKEEAELKESLDRREAMWLRHMKSVANDRLNRPGVSEMKAPDSASRKRQLQAEYGVYYDDSGRPISRDAQSESARRQSASQFVASFEARSKKTAAMTEYERKQAAAAFLADSLRNKKQGDEHQALMDRITNAVARQRTASIIAAERHAASIRRLTKEESDARINSEKKVTDAVAKELAERAKIEERRTRETVRRMGSAAFRHGGSGFGPAIDPVARKAALRDAYGIDGGSLVAGGDPRGNAEELNSRMKERNDRIKAMFNRAGIKTYDPAASRAARAESVRRSTARGHEGSKMNSNIFQLQQVAEDFNAAGFRGASNNLAYLAAQLGGTAGVIALSGLAAVSLGQLAIAGGLIPDPFANATRSAERMNNTMRELAAASSEVELAMIKMSIAAGRSFGELMAKDGKSVTSTSSKVIESLRRTGGKGAPLDAVKRMIEGADDTKIEGMSRFMGMDLEEEMGSVSEAAIKKNTANERKKKLEAIEKKSVEATAAYWAKFGAAGRGDPALMEELDRTLEDRRKELAAMKEEYESSLNPAERKTLKDGAGWWTSAYDTELKGRRKESDAADDEYRVKSSKLDEARKRIRLESEAAAKSLIASEDIAAKRAVAAAVKADPAAMAAIRGTMMSVVKGRLAGATGRAEDNPGIGRARAFDTLGGAIKAAPDMARAEEFDRERKKTYEDILDAERELLRIAEQRIKNNEQEIEQKKKLVEQTMKESASSRDSFMGKGFDLLRNRGRFFMEKAGAPEWMIKQREMGLYKTQAGMLFGQAESAGKVGDHERRLKMLNELQDLQMEVAGSTDNLQLANASFSAAMKTQQLIEQTYAKKKAVTEAEISGLEKLNAATQTYVSQLQVAINAPKIDPVSQDALMKLQQMLALISAVKAGLGAGAAGVTIPGLPAPTPIVSPDGAGGMPKASGGYIKGRGGPTSDDIPARLSNGEYVLRAAAVSKIGRPVLDSMNASGSVPRFASGGSTSLFIDRIEGIREATHRMQWIKWKAEDRRKEAEHQYRLRAIRQNRYSQAGSFSVSNWYDGYGLGKKKPEESPLSVPPLAKSLTPTLPSAMPSYAGMDINIGINEERKQKARAAWLARQQRRAEIAQDKMRARMFRQPGAGADRQTVASRASYDAYLSRQTRLAEHQSAMAARAGAYRAGFANRRNQFNTIEGRKSRSYFGRRRAGYAVGGLVSRNAGIDIGGGVHALGEGYDFMGGVPTWQIEQQRQAQMSAEEFNRRAMADQAARRTKGSMFGAGWGNMYSGGFGGEMYRGGLSPWFRNGQRLNQGSSAGVTDFAGVPTGGYGWMGNTPSSIYSGGFSTRFANGGPVVRSGYEDAISKYAIGGFAQNRGFRQSSIASGGVNNYNARLGNVTINVGSTTDAYSMLGQTVSGQYARMSRKG